MAEPRMLRFVIDCEDDGGDESYDILMSNLMECGEIVSETEIPFES